MSEDGKLPTQPAAGDPPGQDPPSRNPTGRDPRTEVTPDAFRVSDELLGRELATPQRRAVALLVDLILVYALTQAGGLAFVTLLSLTVFWLIVRGSKSWLRRLLRGGLGFVAALVVFLVTLPFFVDMQLGPSAGQWQEFGEAMNSTDPNVREAAILELEESYETAFQDFETVPGMELAGIFGQGDDSQAIDVERLAELPLEESTAAADAIDAFSTALREADAEAMKARRDDVTKWLVGPELDRREEVRRRLVRDYAEVTRENQDLRRKLDTPSLMYLARAVVGDLGLTVGWSGLYFTLFPAFWRGRTPGKFLLRLRIVRLDLSPLRPWTAFERFAGYAAGLATGLLGFLQIFWDANRQGVQDKIVGTVVIRER